MEEIQVFSNKGPKPSQREYKSKNEKLLNIFHNPFFKSNGPISTKFGTKHLWVDGLQIFTNKGPHSPLGEIIAK